MGLHCTVNIIHYYLKYYFLTFAERITSMTTIKLTINSKTGKGEYLLALIKEMAKSDKDILVEDMEEPNTETKKAMNDAQKGKVSMVRSVDELFDSI
jgi:hypothetical protein